jgi:peptidoglycan/LPS O-acetylase OafA/YrhL
VACIVADGRTGRPARAFKAVASFTSRTSYSLYLSHLPMVVFLTAATHDGGRWQPTPRALGEWALALIVTYLFSLAFYRLTEAHTTEVRRTFMRLFVGRVAPAT